METLECSLIFLYGITNVFLEHLTAWGKAWSPMDFEHVVVLLLFIGGGLVSETHLKQSGLSDLNTVRIDGRVKITSWLCRA